MTTPLPHIASTTATRRTFLAAGLATALTGTLSACSKHGSAAGSSDYSTVALAHSSWIGFYPLDLAVAKGFFTKHGVDVKIQNIESKADSKSALIAGRIHGIATTVDTNLMTSTQGAKIIVPLVLDTSNGADGLVAKKSITSFKQLKGRTVALDTTGGASYFWFNYMLRKNNMSLSDITVNSMGSGDAGSAFMAGKVDAAMTWQPWLDKAGSASDGHVLMDSSTSPGVIVDCLGLSQSLVKDAPDKVTGIIRGWYDALDYIKSDPDDAYAIMAKAASMKPEDLKSQMSDQLSLYDAAGNKKFFGTSSDHGPIYALAQEANAIWRNAKLTTKDADIDSLIDPSFVNK